MLPSPRPPATRPKEYSLDADPGFPQERRLKRSLLGQAPTTGSTCESERKSILKISRLAEELKERSTAPVMVPAAKYGASRAKATRADRGALLMHGMVGGLEPYLASDLGFLMFPPDPFGCEGKEEKGR